MRTTQLTVPLAALAIALGSFSAEAQERGERRSRGNQNQGQDASARHAGGRGSREGQESSRTQNRDSRNYERGGSERGASYDRGRNDDRRPSYGGDRGRDASYRREYRNDGRRGGYGYPSYRSYGYRGAWGYANGYNYSPYYYAPRPLPYRYAPRRYYGSGGRLSLYFGFGTGYLYGAPYYGRVYGYRAPVSSYDGDLYYGDIRLLVNPRDAEVYVDGYYAGIVDDFDGRYQRLALEAGPHKIEVGGPGLESRVFDVYVDPSRTVDLRVDLLR
ncbi:MAG: hypothetical protein K1Y01_13300 [Vicinamibacteria bacterium]|nr:hypothetical protein [Vicinamibacteria bacterium]